jgi:multiple sugar transport system substrate-binding protein
LQDRAESQVAGKFAIAPLPPAPGGSSTAVLGGSQLAINVNSDHPHAAYAIITYLLQPEQMRERAQIVGQYPPRVTLYQDNLLPDALAVPPEQVRRMIEQAILRPITPVYAELSEILQIQLHRALTRQQEPAAALAGAATAMRELLEKVGLASDARDEQRR